MPHNNKDRVLKYLYDALYAAEEIEGYNVLSIEATRKTAVKWVIERGIEILSEALKRATVIVPDLAITDLHKIYATRNKIAHEYDLVDSYQLYSIIRKNIPVLVEELKICIKEIETN